MALSSSAKAVIVSRLRGVAESPYVRIDGAVFAWHEPTEPASKSVFSLKDAAFFCSRPLGALLVAGSHQWPFPKALPVTGPMWPKTGWRRAAVFWRPDGDPVGDLPGPIGGVMYGSFQNHAGASTAAQTFVRNLHIVGEAITRIEHLWPTIYGEDLPRLQDERLPPELQAIVPVNVPGGIAATIAASAISSLAKAGELFPSVAPNGWNAWYRHDHNGRTGLVRVHLENGPFIPEAGVNYARVGMEIKDAQAALTGLALWLIDMLERGDFGQQSIETTPSGRRGRKRVPSDLAAKEEALVRDWEAARDSDEPAIKADFAKANGYSLKEFDRLIDRVKKRNRDSD